MSVNYLQQARSLELPSRQAMLERDYSVNTFWQNNQELLINAWQEWEQTEIGNDYPLVDLLLDSKLRDAVKQAS